MRVNVTVNGEQRQADDVWEGESLLFMLRERLGLPGSKNACEQGECGSCTVYLDNVPVCACLVAAGQVAGPRGRARSRGWPTGTSSTRCRRRSSRRARCSAASARPASSWRRTTCSDRVPIAVGSGDPRGAGRKPVPLHGLREDPRRRAVGGDARDDHPRPLSRSSTVDSSGTEHASGHVVVDGRTDPVGRLGSCASAVRVAHLRRRVVVPGHARADQHAPPPLPVGDAGAGRRTRRCSSG